MLNTVHTMLVIVLLIITIPVYGGNKSKNTAVIESIEYVITFPPTGEIITSWGIFTDLQTAIDTAINKAQKSDKGCRDGHC